MVPLALVFLIEGSGMSILTYGEAEEMLQSTFVRVKQIWYGYSKGNVRQFETKAEAADFCKYVELVEVGERLLPSRFEERKQTREAVIQSVLDTHNITRTQYDTIADCERVIYERGWEDCAHGDFDNKIGRIVRMINTFDTLHRQEESCEEPTPCDSCFTNIQPCSD